MDNYEFVELCIKKGNADESGQYKTSAIRC